LDIIARDKELGEIVFIEVKTRSLSKYADTPPEENITHAKMIRLSKIADAYLRLKNLDDAAFRFDAISVWLDLEKRRARIKHIQSI
jgi:Holliday junction resolvase-like predicted endonuclease